MFKKVVASPRCRSEGTAGELLVLRPGGLPFQTGQNPLRTGGVESRLVLVHAVHGQLETSFEDSPWPAGVEVQLVPMSFFFRLTRHSFSPSRDKVCWPRRMRNLEQLEGKYSIKMSFCQGLDPVTFLKTYLV
ncbi:MAG: hypothetical protein A2224_02770 [Candidatus Magasanikbacteria bacterium RIFOXYA2_FULL_40_20]|nr:MAG: hypothetical protein A2224_02770 [Candidatus Magasanikbacteria bacterium RIFOXYA2_FULL_40_20]